LGPEHGFNVQTHGRQITFHKSFKGFECSAHAIVFKTNDSGLLDPGLTCGAQRLSFAGPLPESTHLPEPDSAADVGTIITDHDDHSEMILSALVKPRVKS
jgi:L-ascorbate metabolism protein UlaG (beta-lactamase superfamily)